MTTIHDRYRAHRADGIPARLALTWARTEPAPALDWSAHGDSAELERDGFTVVVRVEPDDIGPGDWVDFTDAAPADPMMERLCRNPRAWDTDGEPLYGSGQYRYVIPASADYAGERAALRLRGVARHDADIRARASVRDSVAMVTSDDYSVSSVVVTTSRLGVELGSSSLGGVDTDGRGARDVHHQLESIIADHDLIGEAIADARETARELCEDMRA